MKNVERVTWISIVFIILVLNIVYLINQDHYISFLSVEINPKQVGASFTLIYREGREIKHEYVDKIQTVKDICQGLRMKNVPARYQ